MLIHVLDRANNRDEVFEQDEGHRAFLRVMRDRMETRPMRILAYCLMPDHGRLLLRPEADKGLGNFLFEILDSSRMGSLLGTPYLKYVQAVLLR